MGNSPQNFPLSQKPEFFLLGGAGTLGEIALSLCSQKLYKNILTPLIFVDPKGVSNEGRELLGEAGGFHR